MKNINYGKFLSKNLPFKIKNQNDEDGMGDNDVKTTKYWLISAGEGSKLWDEFYNEGIIGIKNTNCATK